MAAIPLGWLPPHPDPRAAIAAARARRDDDPEGAFAALCAVAAHDLDLRASAVLGRALREIPGLPRLRLALLGGSSFEHCADPLHAAAARRGLALALHFGGFGQHRQALMGADPEFTAFAAEAVLLVLRAEDVLEPLPLDADADACAAAVGRAVAGLSELWRLARARGMTVIQQNFLPLAPPLFGSFDAQVPATPSALAAALNRETAKAAAVEGVALLDAARWATLHGLAAWHDPARWHHAKQLIAPDAAPFWADLVARLLAALQGRSRKCLVLDLDNTLWGGVIGDDGVEGIVLGQGSAEGEAFLAFQAHARDLAGRGVILAVCSKNDLAVAEAAFRDHPDMVLQRGDFAAFVANWQDKAGNLRGIAAGLNIGLDALVFFDDNPAERALVRRELPEVAVPEPPDDPAGYVGCLAAAGYFEAVAFTEEDRARARQYRDNAARAEVRAAATDMGAFLASLDMRLVVSPFTAVDMPRIAQLTGKTNQFNLTTRRHGQETLAGFAGVPGAVALSFRLLDRFGDNGLISVLVALPEDGGALRIDTWLMSCRVLGRQVEEAIIDYLAEAAAAAGASRLLGEYRRTAKNGMVADLYPRLGFAAADDEGIWWEFDLASHRPHPTHIAVAARAG